MKKLIPRFGEARLQSRGDAFVDLSPELSSAHPGGSTNELLTVYAIVHAVTANLPAVQRVQILIEGKEVDTIAGHVDVRRQVQACQQQLQMHRLIGTGIRVRRREVDVRGARAGPAERGRRLLPV